MNNIGAFSLLAFAFLAAGIGAALPRFIDYSFRLNINIPALTEQIIKLVKAGNISRAIKLCGAAPHAFFAQRIKAVLEAMEKGERNRDVLRELFNRVAKDRLSKTVNLWFFKINIEPEPTAVDEAIRRLRFTMFASGFFVLSSATFFVLSGLKFVYGYFIFFWIALALVIAPERKSKIIKQKSLSSLEKIIEAAINWEN